jgi:hypothetical protein
VTDKDIKSSLDLAADHRISILAAELDEAKANDIPPIVVMSDGTPAGTSLMVNGHSIPYKRISIYASNDPDYSYTDISITLEESNDDGMTVERTLTLRKEPEAKPIN